MTTPETTQRRRQLRRPPAEARCDYYSASLDSLGAPVLSRCPEAATVSALMAEDGMENWICEEHYAKHADRFVRRTKR